VSGYRFTDDWYVAADPQTARDLLRQVEKWPTWWPSCLSVVPAAPQDPRATGEAARYTFQTRLPYRMSFQADVVREEPMALETTVVGRVRGEGRWRLDPVLGGARLHFDWLVDPQVPWMRLLSPVARPVFIWNHASVMAEGARAFAAELGVAMPQPPGTTPPVTAAAAQVAASLAVLAGLVLLVRHASSRGGQVAPGGTRAALSGPGSRRDLGVR
jgi:hypothetical protein